MQYQTFEELGIAPDYLWIGLVAIRNLRAITPRFVVVKKRYDSEYGKAQQRRVREKRAKERR